MNVVKISYKCFCIYDDYLDAYLSKEGRWQCFLSKTHNGSWTTQDEAEQFLKTYQKRLSPQVLTEWITMRISGHVLDFDIESEIIRDNFAVNMQNWMERDSTSP